MIIRIVSMEFSPGKSEEFLKLFEKAREKIEAVDGCLHLDLYRDINNPEQFFTHSHWLSERHLNEYRNSAFFLETWDKTKKMFASKAGAWSVEVIKRKSHWSC